MADGIRKADPSAEIRMLLVSDGGEGTVQTLADATEGVMYQASVTICLAV